jgi:hypothetical protein
MGLFGKRKNTIEDVITLTTLKQIQDKVTTNYTLYIRDENNKPLAILRIAGIGREIPRPGDLYDITERETKDGFSTEMSGTYRVEQVCYNLGMILNENSNELQIGQVKTDNNYKQITVGIPTVVIQKMKKEVKKT